VVESKDFGHILSHIDENAEDRDLQRFVIERDKQAYQLPETSEIYTKQEMEILTSWVEEANREIIMNEKPYTLTEMKHWLRHVADAPFHQKYLRRWEDVEETSMGIGGGTVIIAKFVLVECFSC
jgi:hypothetical protein